MHASAQTQETIAKLVPGGEHALSHLSDDDLLTSTRRLVGASNRLFAQLLLHLAEVETRGVHRTRACSSLYAYCIYELRMSEDAAARRSSAARWVRKFPALLEAVARGELHLTGLLMVAPLLTDQNQVEVLGRAKFRTKKELSKLVRRLAPLPQVPDRVEPLGPPPPAASRSPTWAEFVESLTPPVRNCRPGERPSEWASAPAERELLQQAVANEVSRALARDEGSGEQAPVEPLDEPQLYQMQFTTTEEHAELVERARALLSHREAKLSLGELHLQAMRLLVESLEKQRFGAKAPARCPAAAPGGLDSSAAAVSGPPTPPPPGSGFRPSSFESPRQRGRHVPARLRRAVFERDAGRCTFIDARGVHCSETHHLELHHLQPFARQGRHDLGNLTLRCAAHNALSAEQDFGREHVARKRDGGAHLSRRCAESG